MRRRRFQLWRLLGPCLLAVLLWRVGPRQWWRQVTGADPVWFAVACAMALPLALGKGWRWLQIVRAQGVALSLREAVGIYSAGMVAAAVTPGRVGDLAKVYFLTERGADTGTGLAAVVVDRVIDAGLLVLLATVGIVVVPDLPRAAAVAVGVGTVVGAVAVAALLWSPSVAQRLLRRWDGSRWADRATEAVGSFHVGFRSVGPRWWPIVAAGTVAAWAPYFAAAWCCARALGLALPVVHLVTAVSVAAVLAMVPVTVAGIGTREATFALVLGRGAVTPEQAVALASLLLAWVVVNCAVFYAVSRLTLGQAPATSACGPAPPAAACGSSGDADGGREEA